MTTSLPLAPSGLLGTIAKLLRLTEDLGVEWSHWLHPTNNKTARSNLAEYLKLGCPKVDIAGVVATPSLPEGVDLARFLLGDDFIAPEDVAKAYGIMYTGEQLAIFAKTLPDFETLVWLRGNGFMLVAGPHVDFNLLGLRTLDSSLYYRKDDNDDKWFEETGRKVSQTDMVHGGQWLMLRKGGMPKSRSKNWNEQSMLVDNPERVPNVAEVSYGVAAYLKVRGVYCLSDLYVRTSSVGADGDHFFVGRLCARGLCVNKAHDSHRNIYVAVSSARN